MNVYRLRATCLCPANDGRDHYDVEVRSDKLLRVEALVQFFDGCANFKYFQEDLTAAAKKRFPDAEVHLTGQHPTPVTVESRA